MENTRAINFMKTVFPVAAPKSNKNMNNLLHKRNSNRKWKSNGLLRDDDGLSMAGHITTRRDIHVIKYRDVGYTHD